MNNISYSETFSIKIKEAVRILRELSTNYRDLYENISELTLNKDDEYVLILADRPTRVILGKENINLKGVMIMDFFSLIILNLFLSPVLAFTLYFCFLHSIRHSITLIFELDRSFKLGLKKFITKAIPLTFVTAVIFLFAIYFLNNFYKLDEAIYKVIFIGLASLTFPHILLEYLLEKNEKRT